MKRKEELKILICELIKNIARLYDQKKDYDADDFINIYEKVKEKQDALDKFINEYKNNIDNKNIIYIVSSRDNSHFLFITGNEEEAEKARKKQYDDEEKQGGRPSVFIRKTKQS
jgi:hypothetical protein